MATVFVGGDKVLRWAIRNLHEEGLSEVEDFGANICFGILIDGKPVGACIYNEFREMPFGNDIRVTMVATDPRWCSRSVLRQLLSYPFITAKCTRLTSIVREGNKRAIALNVGLGFKKEGVHRRAYNGKTNALVYAMLRSECKWIEDAKNGQEVEKLRAAAG